MDYDILDGDVNIEDIGLKYKWFCDPNEDSYNVKIMKHIVDILNNYPNMDSAIMMASLNALAYCVETDETYKQVINDIDDMTTEQILTNLNSNEFVGRA